MRKLAPKKIFSCKKQTCICHKKTLIYIKVSLLHFSGSLLCNICQTYLKGLKEFYFKLFLALALASGATRPRLGVSEHPLNPQFQGLKMDLCSYYCPNYFSRSAPDHSSRYMVLHFNFCKNSGLQTRHVVKSTLCVLLPKFKIK